MSKKSPFYKTGPLFYKPGAMSPMNNEVEVTDENNQSDASPATEASNASLGRSTRQRKIDTSKGKLKDVKAKTISLASESKKTGHAKEVLQAAKEL